MAKHMYESIQDNSNPQEKAYSTEIVQKAEDGQGPRARRAQNNTTYITPPLYRPLPLRTWFILMVITISLAIIGLLEYMVKILPAGWTDLDGKILDTNARTFTVSPHSTSGANRRDVMFDRRDTTDISNVLSLDSLFPTASTPDGEAATPNIATTSSSDGSISIIVVVTTSSSDPAFISATDASPVLTSSTPISSTPGSSSPPLSNSDTPTSTSVSTPLDTPTQTSTPFDTPMPTISTSDTSTSGSSSSSIPDAPILITIPVDTPISSSPSDTPTTSSSSPDVPTPTLSSSDTTTSTSTVSDTPTPTLSSSSSITAISTSTTNAIATTSDPTTSSSPNSSSTDTPIPSTTSASDSIIASTATTIIVSFQTSTSSDGGSVSSTTFTDVSSPSPISNTIFFSGVPGPNVTEPEPSQFWDGRKDDGTIATSSEAASSVTTDASETYSTISLLLSFSEYWDGRTPTDPGPITTSAASITPEITDTPNQSQNEDSSTVEPPTIVSTPSAGLPEPTQFFDGRTSSTPDQLTGDPEPTQFFDGRTSSIIDSGPVISIGSVTTPIEMSSQFFDGGMSSIIPSTSVGPVTTSIVTPDPEPTQNSDDSTSSTPDQLTGEPAPTQFFDGRTSSSTATPGLPEPTQFFDGRTTSIPDQLTGDPEPTQFFDGRTSSTSDQLTGDPEPTQFFDGRTSSIINVSPVVSVSSVNVPIGISSQFFDGRTSFSTPSPGEPEPTQFFDGRTTTLNGDGLPILVHGQSTVVSPQDDNTPIISTAFATPDQGTTVGEPQPTQFWDGRETINNDPTSNNNFGGTQSIITSPPFAASPAPTQFWDGRTSTTNRDGIVIVVTKPTVQPSISQNPITIWNNNPTVTGPITLDTPPTGSGFFEVSAPFGSQFWDGRTSSSGNGFVEPSPAQSQFWDGRTGTANDNGQPTAGPNTQGFGSGPFVSDQGHPNSNGQVTGVPNVNNNGQMTTLANGQVTVVPNEQAITLSNGQVTIIPDVLVTTLPNGQVTAVPNVQLTTLSNGQVAVAPNVQVTTLPNGQVTAIPDGQVVVIQNGQVTTLPDGQVTAVPNGQGTGSRFGPSAQGNQGGQDVNSVVLITSGQAVYYSTIQQNTPVTSGQIVYYSTISQGGSLTVVPVTTTLAGVGGNGYIVATNRVNLVTYVYKSTVMGQAIGTAAASPSVELITFVSSSTQPGYVFVPLQSQTGGNGQGPNPTSVSVGNYLAGSSPTAGLASENGTDNATDSRYKTKPFTWAEYFLASYAGTFLAILYSFLWRFIDTEVQQTEPYHQLARPEGASAMNTLCHTYLTTWSYLIPYKAAIKKQWAVFWSSCIFVLALTVVPALSSLVFTAQVPTVCFLPQNYKSHYCVPQLVAPRGPVRILQVCLGFIALLGCVLLYILYQRKPVLYSSPASIASTAVLSQNREFLADFQHGLDDEAWMHHQLSNRRYGLRHNIDRDGSPSYGFVLLERGAPPRPFLAHQKSWLVSMLPSKLMGSYRELPATHGRSRSVGPDGLVRPRRGSISSTRLVIGKKKFVLRWYVLGGFAVILMALGGIILAYENTSSNTIFERFLDSDGFAIKVVATVIGTIIQSFWGPLNKDLQSLAPFHNLLNRNQPPRRSIALSYRHTIPIFTPILCFLNRDFLPFFTGTGVLLSELLTILIPSIPYSSGNSRRATILVSYVSVGIICMMLIFLVVIWVLGRDLKFTRQVETTAGLLSYICASKMMAEVEGLDMMSEKRRTAMLDQMGKRYGLGVIEDEGGSERIAIDEEPLLRSI